MKLRCPIHKKYINNRKTCLITQLFGENKNSLFYGSEGHTGIDFRTKGTLKFIWDAIVGKFTSRKRDINEEYGLIPIVAAHDGYVVSEYNDDYPNGIYVAVNSVDGKYKTIYFHLDKVRVWKEDNRLTASEKKYGENFVKAGSIIGYGGNSGKYTTGAHLHFEMKELGVGGWYSIDPMPFLQDDNVVYQRYYGATVSRWFYKGEEISESQAKNILNNIV